MAFPGQAVFVLIPNQKLHLGVAFLMSMCPTATEQPNQTKQNKTPHKARWNFFWGQRSTGRALSPKHKAPQLYRPLYRLYRPLYRQYRPLALYRLYRPLAWYRLYRPPYRPAVELHTCNPSSWDSGEMGHPWLHSKSEVSLSYMEPHLKRGLL